jgi:hypothetical protein
MDPTNIIVWTRKGFIGSVVSFRSDFQQNLGSNSVMDPSSGLNFCDHQQHKQRHNKQEPTTFILPYGSNKQHCMDKEEFQWFCAVMQDGYVPKFGSKSVMMDPSSGHSFCDHQQPHRHNKQEPTTFILSYGSDKQHCMDKEEFHWLCGVMQV